MRHGGKEPRKTVNDFLKTPTYLYNQLNNIFHFDFDPCPVNPTFDGLSTPWGQRNYANPPYSQKELWIQKAIDELAIGHETVMLLPVDTSTSWFLDLCLPWSHPVWIRGRVKYDKDKAPWAMHASFLAVFGKWPGIYYPSVLDQDPH